MTWVINLYGGPGTGKSTTDAHLFTILKNEGYNVELVREYAKEICWQNLPIDCQLVVMTEQYRRQNILSGKVDVIITDSPLLLTKVYGEDFHLPVGEWSEALYNDFDNYDVSLVRVKKYNPKGRYQCEEDAKKMDKEIFDMVSGFTDIDFLVEADVDAASKIADDFLNRFRAFER